MPSASTPIVAVPALLEPAKAFVSRPATSADLAEIDALHDIAFGPGALTRAAYRVRERQPSPSEFCRVLHLGDILVAAIRYTPVRIGDASNNLMLGPLAVAPVFANRGHGRRLIAESLAAATAAHIELVLLVGDAPYYARFGFVRVPPGRIQMPGPIDRARLLALELLPGSLAVRRGSVVGAA